MNYLHPGASGELDLLALIDLPFYDKWSPKIAGEEIHGELKYRRIEPWYDKPTEVLYVDTDAGHTKVVCSGIVLARQVEEADPRPGVRVHVRFEGQGVSQNTGNTYNKFTFAAED
jgi:hypothetical protein